MKNLFILCFVCVTNLLLSQSVGIGTETPHASAALEVSATNQGILIPRTDTASINSPAAGLLIFQNSDNSFYYYNGNQWATMGKGNSQIQDLDTDTKVTVESTPDDDAIRFISKNVEVMSHNGQSLEMKNNGQSVFIGEKAGSGDDLSDNKNVFIGYKTGENNSSGTHNNAIGNQAMNFNTTGSNNTVMGQQALFKSNGSNNVAIGLNSAKENTNGSKNITIGNFANFTNQSGIDNVIIGDEAGRGATLNSRSGNVLLGSRSGKNTETEGNIALGRDALASNIYGYNNIAIGDSAMQAGSTIDLPSFGSDNVAIGSNAGKNNSTGRKNTFIGTNAASSNTIGSFNSNLGYQSGGSLSSGSHNTMVGFKSGDEVNSGQNNVMLGSEAGAKSTIGGSNVFLGRRAGFVNTEGNNNISIGQEAGLENRTGNNNVYIGHESGRDVIGGSGNVYIGHQSGKEKSGDNQFELSNNTSSTPLIEGRFDSLTTQVNGQLIINNPDSTGYKLPKSDGEFGSLLRSDGDGNPYWFNATSIIGSNTNLPDGSNDDSSDDSDNFEATPCYEYKYFYDIDGIPGDASQLEYADFVVGYGMDYSYTNLSSTANCLNVKISIRKAVDKASPDLFKKSLMNNTIPTLTIHQALSFGGNLKTILEIELNDVKVSKIRHETYHRDTDKYSSYEVLDLLFDEITMKYYIFDNSGTQTGTNEITYDCSNPF